MDFGKEFVLSSSKDVNTPSMAILLAWPDTSVLMRATRCFSFELNEFRLSNSAINIMTYFGNVERALKHTNNDIKTSFLFSNHVLCLYL